MGGEDEKDGSPVVLAPVPNWIGYGQKYAFTDFVAFIKPEMKCWGVIFYAWPKIDDASATCWIFPFLAVISKAGIMHHPPL